MNIYGTYKQRPQNILEMLKLVIKKRSRVRTYVLYLQNYNVPGGVQRLLEEYILPIRIYKKPSFGYLPIPPAALIIFFYK